MLLINGILISICEKNGKRPVEEEWDSKKSAISLRGLNI